METDRLYNREEDEHFRQGDDDNDDNDDTALNTRGLVTEHNKKKKKSGGFQSMGIIFQQQYSIYTCHHCKSHVSAKQIGPNNLI